MFDKAPSVRRSSTVSAGWMMLFRCFPTLFLAFNSRERAQRCRQLEKVVNSVSSVLLVLALLNCWVEKSSKFYMEIYVSLLLIRARMGLVFLSAHGRLLIVCNWIFPSLMLVYYTDACIPESSQAQQTYVSRLFRNLIKNYDGEGAEKATWNPLTMAEIESCETSPLLHDMESLNVFGIRDFGEASKNYFLCWCWWIEAISLRQHVSAKGKMCSRKTKFDMAMEKLVERGKKRQRSSRTLLRN